MVLFITILATVGCQKNAAVMNEVTQQKTLNAKSPISAIEYLNHEIVGLDRISDIGFRNDLIKYMATIENNDKINEYNLYLSQQMKNEWMKNGVRDAKSYSEYPSDLAFERYMEIITFNKISQIKCSVRIGSISQDEGSWYNVKATISFVKEGDTWKFNGIDTSTFDSRQVMEQLKINEYERIAKSTGRYDSNLEKSVE